jgi:hypothetical protein
MDKLYNKEADTINIPIGIDICVPNTIAEIKRQSSSISNCPHCCQPHKYCHEIKFGNFCLYSVQDYVNGNFERLSKEGIKRAFRVVYLIALQFTTFKMTRIYDITCNYAVPKCMEIGSLERSKNYAEMRMNNDLTVEDDISGRIALRNNIFK